jgi:hypothetical protein
MSNPGINVSRRISGGGGSNVTEELRRVRTQGALPIFQVAVVTEVIYDPNLLTTEDKTALADQVVNPRAVVSMPRNSIISRIVSNSNDIGDPRPRIIYPFFQSHFSLPLKAGEQVFVVYPDPHLDGHEQGYWVTRVPEAANVEDVNFTHGDRRYDEQLNSDNQSTSQRGSGGSNSSIPNFPNGAGTPETLSLLVANPNERPFEAIFTGSISNKQVQFEAVPRFTKRPADFVLQGSNNARIVVGEDRTGPATKVSASNQRTDKIGKAGAIDIVVGVGGIRYFPEGNDDNPLETNPEKRPTAPHVIENTRHKKEVNKTAFLQQKQENIKEGDPDFKRDLSRFYVSMKTAGDKNFNIKLTGDDGIYAALTDNVFADIKDALHPALPDGEENGQPFIIAKSDHIRIVAAGKDKENSYGGPENHGDIRLIKEGNIEDKDLSLFAMDKSGNIFALGKNIQLQTHEEGKLFLLCKDNETSNSDPIILFSKFKELEEEVFNKIKALRDGIADQIENHFNTAISVPNAAGPFSPIPALIALKAMAPATKSQIKLIDVDFKSKIDPCKSKWIFVNKDSQSD